LEYLNIAEMVLSELAELTV